MGDMRRVIIILVAINAMLVLFLAGMLYLAETYPFHPGNPLFALQSTAEQARINLTGDPVKRAEFSFELVDRRLADIGLVKKTSQVKLAVRAFDHVLTQALQSIEAVPAEDAQHLYLLAQNLLARSDIVISSVASSISDQSLVDLRVKILSLQTAGSPQELTQMSTSETNIPPGVMAQVIPFLGKDVDHVDCRLTGGHAFLECLDCHTDGLYADTSTSCKTCHDYQDELAVLQKQDYSAYMIKSASYPQHLSGECSDCHGIANWEPVEYDHTGIWECMSCHADDLPLVEEEAQENTQLIGWLVKVKPNKPERAVHYPGDCGACHTDTSDWEEADYDHYLYAHSSCESLDLNISKLTTPTTCLQKLACEDCHTAENPHDSSYTGSCSNCHNDVEDWKNIAVDHTEYESCLNCHEDERPKDHFLGTCSKCHVTSDWETVLFEHKAASDCTSCHTEPARHYGSNCISCHTLSTWHSSFNHALSNCNNCHVNRTDHYDGLCANCHTTIAWGNATFNHIGLTICTECHTEPVNHYVSQCLNCHTTRAWYPVNFNHSGLTDCVKCHSAPTKHDPGQCSDCHNTSEWYSINFDHSSTSLTCSTCHKSPPGHWPGACSSCHNTSDWSDYTFNHSLGYTDCKACHLRPSGHDRGQCSNCHTTDSWSITTPTPLPTYTPTPSNTPLPTFTPTPTETSLPTYTPTPTIVIGTATPTPRPTYYPTVTPTYTPTPTNIPVTPTPQPTPTYYPTVTPVS
jgi:hypothetical protein